MTETFTDYLTTGSGKVEFRLEIEGCPLQFCTSPAMRGLLASGVRRVDGLAREGLSYQESVDMLRADLKSSLSGVTIEDTDDTVAWNKRAASAAFSKVRRAVGFLSATATTTTTTFSVRSSAEFSVDTVYHLDTEAVLVTAKPDSTTLTVTRGMWGTTAQAHYTATTSTIGDVVQLCTIYDCPPTYRRRRVWIYGHGADELTTSDTGTLLARGVVTGPPQLTDGAWSLSISPLVSLLEDEIGPREGTTQIRGIYYPGATPFRLSVDRWGAGMAPWDSRISVYLVGFFESQSAFCSALTTALNDAADTATWTERFSARETGPTWELFVMTAASPNERGFTGDGGSAVDGLFTHFAGLRSTAPGYTARVAVVSPSTEYRVGWERGDGYGVGWPAPGQRTVPRTASYAWHSSPALPSEVATYPWHRLYLANAIGYEVGQSVRVSLPRPSEGFHAMAWTAPITAVDYTDGYIEWDPDSMRWEGIATGDETAGDPRATFYQTIATAECLPTISAAVRDYGTGGSLATVLYNVWRDAPENANGGIVPFVLESDFDTYDNIETAVLEAAAGAPWLLSRVYNFVTPVRFSDFVKHECRLAGLFLCTTSTGAITVRPITTRFPADATISSEDLINDQSFGDLVCEPDGMISGITVRTGYDPAEDEHKGRDLEITSLAGLSIQRKRQTIEIAPKSFAGGGEPTAAQVIAHLLGTITMWSSQRFQVTFDVKVTHHAVRLGDCVYVSIPQLPYDGERSIDGGGGGMINVRGTVVGRRWAFAEPCISLTVLFDSLDVAGYTPTGRVVSQSGSSTTWTLTLEAAEYGPGGDVADADLFVAGMKIRLMEWDTTSPTIRTGTVTGQTGNTVDVELDASWTPGASIWNLCFAKSTTSGLTAAQLRYAWIARDDLRVHLASGTQSAKVFAP